MNCFTENCDAIRVSATDEYWRHPLGFLRHNITSEASGLIIMRLCQSLPMSFVNTFSQKGFVWPACSRP